MITSSDSYSTIDLGKYYAILPADGVVRLAYDEAQISSVLVPPGFAYNSGTNVEFLTVDNLRDLIRKHVDPDFVPL